MKKKIKRCLTLGFCFLFLLLGLFSAIFVFIAPNEPNKIILFITMTTIICFTAFGYYVFFKCTLRVLKNEKK